MRARPHLRTVRTTLLSALLLSLILLAGCTEPERPGSDAEEASGELSETDGDPGEATLLVYVVVDQLRADLLDRYDTVFTGGLARLRAEGHRWENATFDHAQTSTSPGHATAITGVHPHRHGLVGNSWIEQGEDGEWESVYALRQLDSPIVGQPEMEGRGPENLDRGGLPDWIREVHPEAHVVSLSGKDRAAIAMAGRTRGEVYWLDGEVGRFLTSTHYRDDYPEWLEAFHAETFPSIWSDTVWHSQVPEWAEGLSRPDPFPYEGDGENTYFPHRAYEEADGRSESELGAWRDRGPYPDKATLALGVVALRELELGRNGRVDYLALALSQVDRVGHDYGPLSREQLDNLIRLDQGLGEFMELLDQEVGKGRWLMALTADHGVIDLPEARDEAGEYGRRISPDELAAMVTRAEEAAGAAGSESVDRARAAAAAAMEEDWIEDAFAWEDLLAGAPADTLQALFVRSWHPERALGPLGHLGVGMRTVEGAYSGRYPQGTGHGSPYHFDRHVPFMLLGPGIPGGSTSNPVSVVDLAPTIADLLGIPTPDDLDGEVVLR
jgi:hypothetical protein